MTRRPSVEFPPTAMAGVFLAAMATLMYQVLLTRIFSVSMWYHFGFIAISVTMFGMTVGALLVYLAPRAFPDQALDSRLTQSSLVFAVSVVFSLLAHLSIPFMTRPSAVHMFGIGLTYLALAVPFTASGICLTLALTRVPARVGAIYAADLVGAGLGCIAVVGLLEIVDGPSAVILVGAIAALGSLCFALRSGRALVLTGAAVAVLFAAWGALNARLVERQHPLGVRLVWVKGRLETPPIWERWNSFSRLAVWPWTDQPFGWGLSDRWPPDRRVEQLLLNIDASAATVLTRYSGERSQIEHLAYDISNTAHHLRPGSHVLVVGVGGGHDILSALLFEQPRITGVELNGEILDGVNRRFGDYTGQLDRQPGVTLVNDEARSFIARSREQYDIVQVTLIDTWAATASGAFVLSENALYTVEAWARMLDRLSPRGILTFSRFYFKTQPAEVYRLASLAAAALARRGVDAPRGHIVIVRKMRDLDNPDEPNGVGTILVSPQPFTAGDLARVETLCAELGFERVLTPDFALDATFAALASDDPAEARRAQQAAALDITPPTDDRPFFFHMLRLRDFLRRDLWNASMLDFNLKAIFVLAVLLATVLVLTSLCIVVPLWLTRRRVRLEGQAPLFVYFIGIGFGFMLIEIAMMQRLNIFLGHPIYGMTVVLFCLLLASGAGSALSQRFVSDVRQGAAAPAVLGALVGVVTIAMLGSAPLFALFEPAATPFRIAVAALLLVPLGLVMGTAFPLGLRLAADRAEALAPWLWGLNGASSVCASVVVVAISLTAGITMAFAAGAACYVAAGLAFVRARAS